MDKKKILAVLDGIYHSTYRCISYVNYFEMVNENIENRRLKGLNENEFLLVTQNALGDEACLYWYHIFGSDSKDNHLHYSHLLELIDIKGYARNDIKNRFINVIPHSKEQYKEFHKNMTDIRNKCLAHKAISETRNLFDIKEENIGKIDYLYPNLEICKKMCEEFLRIIHEIIEKLLNGNYSLIVHDDNEDNYYRTLTSMSYVINQARRIINKNCSEQYNEIIHNQ